MLSINLGQCERIWSYHGQLQAVAIKFNGFVYALSWLNNKFSAVGCGVCSALGPLRTEMNWVLSLAGWI